MLYQGTMGPHHLLDEMNIAHSSLRNEFKKLGKKRENEPLTERVSIDGSVVRINLRPYKHSLKDPDTLFTCMTESAASMVPDKGRLRSLWNTFKELTANGLLDFNHHEIIALEHLLTAEGYHPVHHSPEYRSKECPAYRVVLLRCFEQMVGST
jgi:hypothetical protein